MSQPIVAESSLSYTPPPEAPPAEQQEFQQSLKDIVSEIEGEFGADKAKEFDLPADPAEPTVAPEADATSAPEPKTEEDPTIARGMDRLVQREVALQTREAQIAAREAEYNQLREKVQALESKLPAADVTNKLLYSPSEAIKALGHDPGMVARLLIAEQMRADGKEVPPALQAYVDRAEQIRAQTTQSSEIAQLKAQLAERDRMEKAAAYFNSVALGARDFVTKSVADSKTLPTLAVIAKTNPERAHREIMEEITNDARSRMSTDPNGEPMTYEQAAKKVETRLSEWKSLLVQTPTGTTQIQPGAATKPPVTPKPPEKPLKPWEAPANDIYKQGISEAMREYYRMEQTRKAQR